MSKNSKAYRAALEKIDRDNLYSPLEAAKLAKETSSTKQDSTVEVAIRLGVDPRKADQMVRGTVNLPHGTGKTARVAVFAVGEKADEATAAGADVVGSDDLIEKIQGGFLDFDAAIATPDQMAKVGRIARILGPRGLMPNPKTGTVTPDITKAVTEIKGGKINFRQRPLPEEDHGLDDHRTGHPGRPGGRPKLLRGVGKDAVHRRVLTANSTVIS
jgi:large subunit ribosomal protein L1